MFADDLFQYLVLEATTLPTEPHCCPYSSISFNELLYQKLYSNPQQFSIVGYKISLATAQDQLQTDWDQCYRTILLATVYLRTST